MDGLPALAPSPANVMCRQARQGKAGQVMEQPPPCAAINRRPLLLVSAAAPAGYCSCQPTSDGGDSDMYTKRKSEKQDD